MEPLRVRNMVQLFIMVFKIRINKHKTVVINTFNYPRKSEISELPFHRKMKVFLQVERILGMKLDVS